MTLQALVSNNYEYLNKVAKRIASRRDYALASDLFNHAYQEISDRGIIFPKDDEGFVKWFSKYMKNLFSLSRSSFNLMYFQKEYLTGDMDDFIYPDPDALAEIEIAVEDTNEVTREIIEMSSSLGKAKTLRFIEVIEFKRSLPEHEKLLFELYFENNLSTRDIADKYSDEDHKMGHTAVNAMINVIKTKIRQQQWKQ